MKRLALSLLTLAAFSATAQEPEVPAAASAEAAPAPPAASAPVAAGTEKAASGITFVWCPPGTYSRGMQLSVEELQQQLRGARPEWYSDAAPVHEVTLTRGFWISKTEVTREQWRTVMSTEPWRDASRPEDLTLPVTSITPEDCLAFFLKLGEQAGGVFRLPTEAEWEYACRAGTTTPFYFGATADQVNEHVWNWANTTRVKEPWPHSAGLLKPNAWGLHDMLGNVWEWCQDVYAPYEAGPQTDPLAEGDAPRVIRGSSYIEWASLQLSSYRSAADPKVRNPAIGFRVVMEP